MRLQEHESDVFASSTNTQPFGQSTHLAPASPTLPGGFPGILPPFSFTPPMLSWSVISLSSSIAPQAKSKTPARYVLQLLQPSPQLTQISRFRFPQTTEGICRSLQARFSFAHSSQEKTARKVQTLFPRRLRRTGEGSSPPPSPFDPSYSRSVQRDFTVNVSFIHRKHGARRSSSSTGSNQPTLFCRRYLGPRAALASRRRQR